MVILFGLKNNIFKPLVQNKVQITLPHNCWKIWTCISKILTRISQMLEALQLLVSPGITILGWLSIWGLISCLQVGESQASGSNSVFMSLERKWSCKECLGNVCQESEKGIDFLMLHFSLSEENKNSTVSRNHHAKSEAAWGFKVLLYDIE